MPTPTERDNNTTARPVSCSRAGNSDSKAAVDAPEVITPNVLISPIVVQREPGAVAEKNGQRRSSAFRCRLCRIAGALALATRPYPVGQPAEQDQHTAGKHQQGLIEVILFGRA